MSVTAILALEDGSIFKGTAIGNIANVDNKNNSYYKCGELVFNTSITGYQEIISDPSYCEQIILFTQPHIGNVGVNSEDIESNLQSGIEHKHTWSNGIVVKYLSTIDSNWRSHSTLNKYLITNNLIGIANIDTRALTNLLRDKGAQKACIFIFDEAKAKEHKHKIEYYEKQAIELAQNHQSLNNQDLAKEVSTDKCYIYDASQDNKYNIIAYDFGIKKNILNILNKHNCKITVVPAQTSYEELIDSNLIQGSIDGIMLSNGPGDPSACQYAIENTKKFIAAGVPIFGICLGFQILALALGLRTEKMKFGHHGANHPVKDLSSNKVFITSQNHGFMVSEDSVNINPDLNITHRSLFDNTIQGFAHNSLPIFGFQGHPEASPGPHDLEYLFKNFINNIAAYKNHIKNFDQDINKDSDIDFLNQINSM